VDKGKDKGCPVFVNESLVPGYDHGPGPSPLQVAFSRAGAIQGLGGRSIHRTCGYLRRFLNSATHYTPSARGRIFG